MSKKIKVGLVGCGRIMPIHLHGYKALMEKGFEVEIRALCDKHIENALRFRKRSEGLQPRDPVGPPGDPLHAPHIYVSDFQKSGIDIELYDNYKNMLKEADIDAVDIYTSVDTHHFITIDSLYEDKHVMVEKPIAITVKAARKMVEAAEKAKKVLGVGEGIHFIPGMRKTKWVIDQGCIGNIQLVFQAGLGGWWSPDKIVAETPWRHLKLQAGGGVTLDMGVHFLSLLRSYCGEVESVQGIVRIFEDTRVNRDKTGKIIQRIKSEVDDTFLAILKFKSGALGQISYSWALHGPPIMMFPTIYGTKGSIKSNIVNLDDGTKRNVNQLFDENASQGIKDKFFPYGLTDAAALETLDFLNAILEGNEMEISGKEGLKDLAIAYAIIESSYLDRSVLVDDIEKGKTSFYESDINKHFNL